MADNLAPMLLVAGIVGAVVGAAASERFHFPSGLVYGGIERPSPRLAIDPRSGSGRADEVDREDGPSRLVPEPPPPDYYPPPSQWYRPPPRRPAPRMAWCWREFEDWNFRTTGRYVRCPAGSVGRRARDDG
jgi:hypothetical protein